MLRRCTVFSLLFLLLAVAASAESFRFPAAERVVAIGDLHGDLEATRAAFRLGGAIDENDRWIGGELVVVQTGDQIDRGGDEQEILDLLEKLRAEATAAGGALHILNGNHELMNARPDLRYVTEEGFADFAEFAADLATDELDSLLLAHPPEQRGRIVAFRPGGPYAKILAERNLYVIVGENLFVHGGITPAHLKMGLEVLNSYMRDWLAGRGGCPPILHKGASPTWERRYSDEVGRDDCATLHSVLKNLGVKRMVVGHTIQEEGIGSFCADGVWCIDVGMAEHYGGPVQVLEIIGDEIRPLAIP